MRIEGQRESDNVEDRRGMGRPIGAEAASASGHCPRAGRQLFHRSQSLTVFNMLNGVQSVTETVASAPIGVRTCRRATRPTRQICLGRPGRYRNHLAHCSSAPVTKTRAWSSSPVPSNPLAARPPRPSALSIARATRVYLDLAFFDEMAHRLGAAGDFAQAYVIAHEVGHHVQNLLGVAEKSASPPATGLRNGSECPSVRMELQADFMPACGDTTPSKNAI